MAKYCGLFGVRGFFFGEDLLEEVGAVGDDAVDAEVDEGAHLCGVVGGPGDDLEAGFVELGYVDGGVGADEGGVDGREDGSLGAVGLGVGVGCGHESEEGVLTFIAGMVVRRVAAESDGSDGD